ncbi:MAG: ChbG/HpnK family deacetylase [Erysipelotrichaceae bacterium]|nr:ChbG/HpnK family deacetylase [Erysipelotrichaceae bacterium]
MSSLIMRADDLGFSEGVNYGIAKAVFDGVITSVGLMTNMDAIEHGYQLIKDADIALGQHTNICVGKPICDPQDIPSLVGADGMFCSSREIRSRTVDTVVIEEAEREIEAQLKRFIDITGRVPDYFEAHAVSSKNFFKALKNVSERHHLFYENAVMDKEWEEEHQMYGLMGRPDEHNLYDPLALLNDNLDFILSHESTIVIFHPGYLDQYILDHSSYTVIRPMETAFLCGEDIKRFIEDNHLTLKKLKREV